MRVTFCNTVYFLVTAIFEHLHYIAVLRSRADIWSFVDTIDEMKKNRIILTILKITIYSFLR